MKTPAAPALPPIDAQTRLLVVAPHPDDETIATGILIQQVVAAGGVIRVLLLTAGDNNPWPQRWVERRWRIGPRERDRWGRRRLGELRRALERLGVGVDELHCLGWPDMGLTEVLMNPAGGAVGALQTSIDAFAPSLVAMPSLDDHHPDHGAAHVLIRLAAAHSTCRPRLLAYLVHGRVRDGRYVALAGSAAQQANKLTALQQHRSQMVLSGRRMQSWAAQPESYMEVQASSTYSTRVLPWQPAPWLRRWLRLSLANSVIKASWHLREAPLKRAVDGSLYLEGEVAATGSPSFVKLTWDLRTFWIFDHWGWHEL